MKKQKHNPRLKAAVLEVVDNQLKDNNPPETRQSFERLVGLGVSEANAKIYIGQAVAFEIYEMMTNKIPFDHDRFVQNLDKLPNLIEP
jgi:hypothetical protein